MPSAVRLREDYSAEELRTDARRVERTSARAVVFCRWLRFEMEWTGRRRAKIGGMDRQTLRDWVHRFNALGPDGLIDTRTKKVPSLACRRNSWLSSRRSWRLARTMRKMASSGGGEVDLKRVIAERFGVEFHPRYVGKLLKKLGFSHISARPRHPGQTSGSSKRLEELPARAESFISGESPRRRRWKSGSKMKPESARRTASSASGPGVERGPYSPLTNATTTPICSARSARREAWERRWRCPTLIPT